MSASANPSVPDLSNAESADRFFLIARSAEAADGQPPFSDQSLVELRTGKRQPLVIDGVAAAIVSPTEAELVVWPYVRGVGYGTALLEAIIARSTGELLVWAHGDHPAARALARSHGLEPVRELLQLRAPVPEIGDRTEPGDRVEPGDRARRDPHEAPLGEVSIPTAPPPDSSNRADWRRGPSSTSEAGATRISAFRPGTDDAAWLHLNAVAFAHHPEQGRADQSDLDELKTEDWFDAGDFLVLRDGEAMIGFCWLKIQGELGEFYAVGVDPEGQGDGLGRRLVGAGMTRLAERGIRTALLYVEADNAPALGLYRSFGFETHSVDVRYRLTRP